MHVVLRAIVVTSQRYARQRAMPSLERKRARSSMRLTALVLLSLRLSMNFLLRVTMIMCWTN